MPVLESPAKIMKPSDVSCSLKVPKDSDNVFVCEVTGKAFTEYGDFAYNFMNLRMEHWRCEYTKRGNLTYMQALESKQKVSKQAINLPKPIRLAVFHLINKSKHTRQELLAHDVFFFVKDRYFKGETVNMFMKATKNYTPALITAVSTISDSSFVEDIPPQVCSYQLTMQPKKGAIPNGQSHLTVGFDAIKRSPRVYTEVVNRCLVYTNTKIGADGYLYLTEKAMTEMISVNYVDIFAGIQIPELKAQKSVVRLIKHVNNSLNSATFNKSQKANGFVDTKKQEVSVNYDAKEKFKEILKTWHLHKDDLLLDDHKMLPNFPMISFEGIPNRMIGELLTVVSFFDDFSESDEIKDLFGFTVDFEKLANSITKPDHINDFYEIVYKLNNFLLKRNENLEKVQKEDKDYESDSSSWMNNYSKLLANEGEINSIVMSEILRLQLVKFCQLNCKQAENQGSSFSADFCSVARQLNDKLTTMHAAYLHVDDKIGLLKALLKEITLCDDVRQCAEKSREEARQFVYNLSRVRATRLKYGSAIPRYKKGKKPDNPEESLEDMMAKYKEADEKLQEMLANYPSPRCFGRDRAYRRYLLFKSIPALCVETNSNYAGVCQDNLVIPDPILSKCSYSEKLKELRKRCFTQRMRHSIGQTPQENTHTQLTRLNMCYSSKDLCPLHKPAPEVWQYISTPEMLTDLLTSLNDRGIRESSLKKALKQSKAYIEECFNKCPLPRMLNPALSTSGNLDASYIEKKLRSVICLFEDKLSYNELGKADVKDRDEWLSRVILKGEVDTINPPLHWGPEQQFSESSDINTDESYRLHITNEQWVKHKKIISNLRGIILRLERGINRDHLKDPLVTIKRSGYRRVRQYENIDKWEHSLMSKTTSIAQLALHLKALQDSVMWEKSVHRRFCSRCKKTTNYFKMVRCEKCNDSYHVFCLKPKRKTVPTGTWLCVKCKVLPEVEIPQEPENIILNGTISPDEAPNKITKLMNGYEMCNGAEIKLIKLQPTLDSFFKKATPTNDDNLSRNGETRVEGRTKRTRKLC